MHGWIKWAFVLTCHSRDSKTIVSYTQIVMQLDIKLAFLKIASWKQLCVVMINTTVCSSHFYLCIQLTHGA